VVKVDGSGGKLARVLGVVVVAIGVTLPVSAQATQGVHTAQGQRATTTDRSAARTGSSGADATCPATTPADAGSSAVSAPVDVRAIAGQSSATVVWCPPASGASSVVSYTVTASPGGASVTATVPNDWAIIDGLTNGTAYTFTVTANTSASASSAATTNAITPEPVAPPRDVLTGARQTVSYDGYSMIIGGKRVFITAGEFDPWRTPSPSLWLDDLQKMKADGYNAVTVYFDWDYNSATPGAYDFTGVRDMNEFLNMAQRAGLYVIARPGPYINAETDGGGIPSWVLTSPNGYRTDTQPYLSAALQWFSQMDAIIAPHQITRGGNVILYQIENEYTGQGTAANQYMADLEQQATADGINVPYTFNQCCGAQTFTSGLGAVNISGTDNYPVGFNCANTTSFGQPYGYPRYASEPVYLPEYQGGSFDAWGGSGQDNCYTMTGPSFENVYYKNNIAQGATMQSYYMGVGGTNWGWLPANFIYTSYDYGAAIRETGEIGTPSNPNSIAGSKYGENKLINNFETSVAPLAQTDAAAAPTPDNPAIATMGRVNPSDGTEFVYVRQADATSTATASTHLALNTDEAACCTYDDTDAALSYSGTWTHAGLSSGYTNGDYNSTESWSQTTGSSVTVTFTGTAVQWIGPKNNNAGIAAVSIDGGTAANVDTYSSAGKEYQQVLFTATGLSAGTHTLTITVTGTKDAAATEATVVVDAINVPTAAQLADYFPVVPQSGTLTLQGRDSKLLVANYTFGGQHLVYSTSEIASQQTSSGHGEVGGGTDTVLLYGNSGTDGETVLNYTSQPTVNVSGGGNVTSTWDASRGDLRLDYTHSGVQEVRITGGGRSPLLLILADTNSAENFWPEQTNAGPVLIEGGYLVRSATVRDGGTLELTGDTSASGNLVIWGAAHTRYVTWNGTTVAVSRGADGSLSGTVPGPETETLPALSGWKFAYESQYLAPGYDDGSWTLADHPVSNASSPSTPVLYASDYGYNHGFVWYRGHFTGSAAGITLRADGVSPTGAYSVWLNGVFLGSGQAAGASQHTFTFPSGAVRSGADNVVAVLLENTGNPEGPNGEKTGLYSAVLNGSSATVTWRLHGASSAEGSSTLDSVRGIMNGAGLYGSDHGWSLAGYPDRNWTSVTVPDSWASRGVPAGVGWYRTTFRLNLPRDTYGPIYVQIGGAAPGAGSADYRAFIYVNGWLVGRYVNNVGPQHQFYVPAGILNDHGQNTISIADWSLDDTTGGLDKVSLVAAGTQATSLDVRQVESPGYNASVYGPPSQLQPVLGVVPSTALAAGTFTVKATLSNPSRAGLSDASVTLAVPAGWTVSPSAASLGTVAPGADPAAAFTVTAPSSGQTAGTVALLATAVWGAGAAGGGTTLQNSATVQAPYSSLAASFDNTGITSNVNTNPSSAFTGFDGIGTSYSAEGLATAGLTPGATVTAGGLSFTWPNVTVAPGNTMADNTMAEGQTIAVHGSGSSLGFLAAANNSPLSGTGTVYYTDGTTQTFSLNIGNFWYPSGSNGNPANTAVASVNYANYPTGPSTHTIYVFEQSVPVDSSKTVEAIQLPSLGDVAGYNAALHIFAVAVG
jgi:beta-galactosidase GanA